MKRILLTASLLIAGTPVMAMAQTADRVVAPVGGISIAKPAGWHVVPPGAVLQNLKELDTPAAAKALAAPLITIMKYPFDHAGIIPTIKINYHSLPAEARQLSPIRIAEAILQDFRRVLGEVTVLDAPASAPIAEMDGAHLRVSYTLRRDGDVASSVSEAWVVKHGNGFFVIGVGYSPDEPVGTQDEIRGALATLRIDPR